MVDCTVNTGGLVLKFLGYQLIAIAVIWTGMAFFFDRLSGLELTVFYVVSGWLLFLIISLVKALIKRKDHDGE